MFEKHDFNLKDHHAVPSEALWERLIIVAEILEERGYIMRLTDQKITISCFDDDEAFLFFSYPDDSNTYQVNVFVSEAPLNIQIMKIVDTIKEEDIELKCV